MKHMVDQVTCTRTNCVHRAACVVVKSPDRSKPIEKRGTFFPTLNLDWSGAWFVHCEHFQAREEASPRQAER